MRKTESHILIIDDDPNILFTIKVFLKRFFATITTIDSPKKINDVFNKNVVDVVVLDMNFRKGIADGKEGIYWLKYIQGVSPETVIIMMTAHSDVNIAVESLKLGAFDFILKPWNNEKLLATIHAGVQLNRKLNTSSKLEQLNANSFYKNNNWFIGNSPAFQHVLHIVKKVSNTDANILLLGENGTGKYVIAKMIHQNSDRKNNAFIHVDLGSLSENLFESELFGYAKGAFTDAKESRLGRFELADKGTIFLDEIGNLPYHLQTKLLTVLQNKKIVRLGEAKERSIDVRIICATNANLMEAISEKTFREDLLYRINTVEITLPPLRERKEDIVPLALFFLEKNKKKYKKGKLQLSQKAKQEMENYSWAGNIRELEHVIERAVILCDKNEIHLEDLHFSTTNFSSNQPQTLNLEEMEKHLISEALKKHKGHITKAAKELGITRAALYRRMEKFEL